MKMPGRSRSDRKCHQESISFRKCQEESNSGVSGRLGKWMEVSGHGSPTLSPSPSQHSLTVTLTHSHSRSPAHPLNHSHFQPLSLSFSLFSLYGTAPRLCHLKISIFPKPDPTDIVTEVFVFCPPKVPKYTQISRNQLCSCSSST